MLCKSPVLHAAEDFISIAEIGAIVGRADDAAWLAGHGVTTRHNFTGWSCELPVAAESLVAAVAARIYAVVGLRNELGQTLQLRRSAPGEHHPRHFDTYALGDRVLVATAMLWLGAALTTGWPFSIVARVRRSAPHASALY